MLSGSEWVQGRALPLAGSLLLSGSEWVQGTPCPCRSTPEVDPCTGRLPACWLTVFRTN